jgi:hypothetical protein
LPPSATRTRRLASLFGTVEVVWSWPFLRAQYVRDELTRRAQNRQTCLMIVMTFVITVMTGVIMTATVYPECVKQWVQSVVHWLLTLIR